MYFSMKWNKKISITLLFTTVFCNNPSEVLVEYKNGDKIETIQRKDLQFIVKLNNFQRKEELSVATQNQILDELSFLATGKLAFESLPDDVKKQLDKEIKKSLIMLDQRAFMNGMNLILQEKSSSFIYKLINMQLLFLKKDDKLYRNEEAKQILKQLNEAKNEEEIEKIIFEKNENIRYKILGGLVDPICYNCGQNPVTNLTEPLLDKENKDKKFILVEDNNGYWIVRNLGTNEVKEDELKKVYEEYHKKSQFAARKFLNNPNYTKEFNENELNAIKQQLLMDEKKVEQFSEEQAKHQANMLKKSALTNHLQELQKKYNFKLNEETLKELGDNPLSQWNEDLELFQYDNKSYKIKDFFDEIRKSGVEPKELTFNEVAPLLNQVYVSYTILQKSPYVNEAKKYQDIFKDLIIKQIYTNYYIQKEFEKIQVSEEEIKKYYELRKNNEFKVKNGNKEVILPLKEVNDRIKQILLTEKRQKRVMEIKEELFKKYNVKIYKERLKEGKV
ncbi:MAG: hypothetical protein KatS3mg129_1495 [Leptospiraceae bacterium]|nr:MAG: hypothetical protein KatS3mg129_1495 [Leptospiraceae bacterium]